MASWWPFEPGGELAVVAVVDLGPELAQHPLDVGTVDVGADRVGEQGMQHLAMAMVHGWGSSRRR